MRYVYRFDTLSGLRAQQLDPVLRARRVTKAHGAFDHHQVLSELAAVGNAKGVYRFCFWRNWDAATKHFRATMNTFSPGVLQRVRADHPAFAKFHRDEDEYLPGEAWIFWQSSHIDPARPEWSSDGIPHDDIDVLTFDGHWQRLSTSHLMRDPTFDSWRCLPLQGNGGPTHVFARTLCRRVGSDNQVWVLLRQGNRPWTTVWENPALLAQAVTLMLGELSAVGLANVRWVVSLECDDRILSAEFRPDFEVPTLGFLARMLGHRRVALDDLEVSVDKQTSLLDEVTQRQLYGDFGIAEVLLLNRRYQYPLHVLERDTDVLTDALPL